MSRENIRCNSTLAAYMGIIMLATIWTVADADRALAQTKAPCKEMRKIKIGVSVSPPNVVHTPVYVARSLGIFTRNCIDAEIVEFEGGASAGDREDENILFSRFQIAF